MKGTATLSASRRADSRTLEARTGRSSIDVGIAIPLRQWSQHTSDNPLHGPLFPRCHGNKVASVNQRTNSSAATPTTITPIAHALVPINANGPNVGGCGSGSEKNAGPMTRA